MRKVFLDTNILVPYYLGLEPVCSQCKRFIVLASEGKLSLYVSSHSLKDLFYILCEQLKSVESSATGEVSEEYALAAKEAAWASVDHMGKQATIVSVGRNEHEHAFVYRSLHNDYEDNLQIAAAYTAKADLLITNDKSLRGHSPIAALSSTDALALLEAELAKQLLKQLPK